MTDYIHEPALVADSASFQRAPNASIMVYDADDATNAVPLVLKDLNGLPVANPVSSSQDAFTPWLVTSSAQIKLVGGGLTVIVSSYKGLREDALAAQAEAQAARTAAEAAQAAAEAAGADAAEAASAALATAVGEAEDAKDAAVAAAALVGAPADTAISTAINAPASATRAALNATYVGLKQAAKNPDLLIAGAVTLDGSDQVTSAAVLWPDGTPGTLTITSRDATGAVTGYNITYGSPVTKTFTQPTITRNANGAATNVPQIVVS
jgi:hypothetical protein